MNVRHKLGTLHETTKTRSEPWVRESDSNLSRFLYTVRRLLEDVRTVLDFIFCLTGFLGGFMMVSITGYWRNRGN